MSARSKKAKAIEGTRPPATTGWSSDLFERIAFRLHEARARVARAVNNEMVLTYWHIGRELVEHVQRGDDRAGYGDEVIESLSARLTEAFGRGFSTTNLRYFRNLFTAYRDRVPEIRHITSGESATAVPAASGSVLDELERAVQVAGAARGFAPLLGWSHDRALMTVESEPERLFYEIEAERERWSVPHLRRQIETRLFHRLLKSRDKAGVMALATQGQVVKRPLDVLRDPYVLDFLALPEAHSLRESDLEGALIENLQHFLLELGTGFAFIGREKRISFEDRRSAVDLKLGSLTHQDVGQMDGYVRLYDDLCRHEGDGPTVGLILCAEKNDAVARYSSLHDSEHLFAARSETYLPTVEALQAELRRERARRGDDCRRAGGCEQNREAEVTRAVSPNALAGARRGPSDPDVAQGTRRAILDSPERPRVESRAFAKSTVPRVRLPARERADSPVYGPHFAHGHERSTAYDGQMRRRRDELTMRLLSRPAPALETLVARPGRACETPIDPPPADARVAHDAATQPEFAR